jgi:hypothetical protein
MSQEERHEETRDEGLVGHAGMMSMGADFCKKGRLK